jgi:type I restriction enzyme S subunit
MTSKWERVRLGEYILQVRGVSYSPDDVSDTPNGDYIPILRANNIQNEGLNFDDLIYIHNSKISQEQLIREGDIVVCTSSGSKNLVGKSARAQKGLNVSFGAFCKVVRVNKTINSQYIGHYFNSPQYRQIISNLSGGANINNIRNEHIANLTIPLPPLDEQKRIADVLDKASELIKKRKEQIRLMDELAKSLFIEMFGDLGYNPYNWPIMQLYELGENAGSIKCGPFGTQLNKEEYQVTGTPLWGIPEINHSFKLLPKDYLSDEKARSLEAYSVVSNDIVMSRKGNVGKCAIYPSNFPKGIIHSDVLRIRPNQRKINSWFLIYQLHGSNYILSQISDVSNGAIMKGINVTKLKNINIHVPPISLQQEFADRIDAIEKQKALLQDGLAKMETAYKALMQEYFG